MQKLSKNGLSALKRSVFVFVIFLALFSFFPRFDGQNWHALVSAHENTTFFDERFDIVSASVLNLREGKTCFAQGSMLGSVNVSENVDFVVDSAGCYWPTRSVFAASTFLLPFSFLSSLVGLQTALLFGNAVFASILLSVLYLTLRLFYRKYAFVFTLLAGLATGIVIYVPLLLTQIISATFFMLFMFGALGLYKTRDHRFVYLLHAALLPFVLAFPYTYLLKTPLGLLVGHILSGVLNYALFLALPFGVLLYSEKLLTKRDLFTLGFVYVCAVAVLKLFFTAYHASSGFWVSQDVSVFPFNPGGLVTELFGFSPLLRVQTFVYSFAGWANGLFLNSYGLFGALFSEKGFIYNSPFLLFGLLGALFFKPRKLRNALLFVVGVNLVVSLVSGAWHGGATPRYVRHYFPAILVLCIFAFDYLSQNKSQFVRAVFVLLALLSVLNVSSLAVRQDWVYENPADLVSYDYVLFPVIPTLHNPLYGAWNTSVTCPATNTSQGLLLDMCSCNDASFITKELNFSNYGQLSVFYCTNYAGDDGVVLDVSAGGFMQRQTVASETCGRMVIPSSVFGVESLWIGIDRYGECAAEQVTIKGVFAE